MAMENNEEVTESTSGSTAAEGEGQGQQQDSQPLLHEIEESDADPGSEGGGEGDGKPATPAYQPNFKFKVMDQEKEFDEFLRGAIKDADTEKKVRELYEKAHGLDHVKPKLQKERDEKQHWQGEYKDLAGGVQAVMGYAKTEDFDAFFQQLGIPEQSVVRWVAKKLQLLEASPEERAAYERNVGDRRRLMQLERDNASLVETHESQQVQAVDRDVTTTLESPVVKAYAEAFDARVGTPGAFRNEVLTRGSYHFNQKGQILPAAQLAQELMSLFGPQAAPPPPPVPGAAPQGQLPPGRTPSATPAGAGGRKPPVIPNVGAKPGSPTAKVFKTIEDIEKHRKEKYG